MQPTRMLFLGLVIVILLPAVAQAQNTTCYRGGSLLPNYTLNNATLSGTDILVTPDLGNQLASVFFNPTFDPTKNLYVKMVFKITTTTGTGADGMAFVLQNDTRGVNAIGLAGEGIGYGYHTGTPAAPNGEVVIKPSVVVEFDTYYNAARGDPNDTNDITYGHIGLTLNGDPNHADFPAGYLKDLLGTGYRLKSNAPLYAWLDYTASTHTLNVYLNNVNTKPATPMLTSTAINLATQLGSKFYMGFSGSTGGNQSKHEVMEFYASDSATQPDSECCNVDADCVSSALGPVCDPQKHVCGQCTIADTSHCTQQPSACDLSGASNTCVPDCDGNYGSGTTHPCVSANFPFCRLSGPGAGSCEVCAGDYGAGSSPACVLNSPYCSVVGYCGFCTVNADCTAAGPPHTGVVCNTANGRCVQCVSNADCANPTPSCIGNVCVACNGDYPAGGTQPCQSSALPGCVSGSCYQCSSDAQCTDITSATCGPTTHICTACNGDNGSGMSHQCNSTSQPVCLPSGACVQCTTAKPGQCTGPTPVCDATTDTCSACNGDYGSGQSHACTGAAAPACLASGACVQCSAYNSTACSGNTPMCDTTNNVCARCNGNFGSGNTLACPLSSAPACITAGGDPFRGACKQCKTGVTSLCVSPDQCHQSGSCDLPTYTCTFPNQPNGTACNDGNLCTQTDTCQLGVCTGGNPVVCSALDQCHDAGVCHPSTGVCTNPIKTDGTGCNDGNSCTQTDTCQSGTCTGSNPVVCPTPDQCHDAGVCNTSTGVCSNPNKTDGTACNDGNACTHTDTCQTGVCTGTNPVVCTALDQCHNVGVCNTSTGICSNPNKIDGTGCNDGNACTLTDICQAGTCIGGNPVVCSALDQCHQAGVCDPISSLCSDPIQPNGTACNDGNACTQTDTCQSGSCSGSNPVVCSALDQCHNVGVCNTSTGACSNPNKIDGTACNDGNACTHTDTCQTGACTGSNPVVCTALDQCHNVGVCNTSTGICSNPNKIDGTACNDSNACTQTDTCQSGTCTGTNPILCTPIDQCHQTGVCDPISSLCSDPIQPNGTTCNDGNACTQTDACQSGTCSGSNLVVCSALDQCHDVGVCNTTTGVCSNPNKTDGTACNDGNACTHTDTCQTGVCTGSNPVVCSALDQCHDVGVCNTTTGACSNPAKSDGTACSDSNNCTQTDTCQSGTCTGSNSVVCPTPDQCHTAGTCDPGTGICSNPTKPDGTGCSDGDACTYPDTCQSGTCVAANSIVCVAQDECHDPGSCDPSSGSCSNPVKTDDTPCALGLGSCLAGVCKSNDGQPCTDASACTSTYCVDGYCCDQTCTGQCEACNLPGALGHCGPVTGTPQSPRPACTAVDPACAGQCDGTRRIACTYPGTETQCRQAQCVDGVATQAESCNGTGACPPIQTQTCDPYVCGPSLCRGDCLVDQDCVTGYFCATGICQQTLPPGQLCDRNVQCISGHCVDNVCCDLPCTGQCEACNLIASPGTCSAVTGAPVGARPPCDSDGGMCSGQCDGLRHDGCSYPGSDQECRPASCQSDLATVRAVCDGAGSCPPPHTQPCIPYRCGDTQCKGNCVVDEDCDDGYWCTAGVCVAKHDLGTDCTGAHECLSGFCADGVCCDSTCLGQCQACNLENHRGSCTPVTGAPLPGHAPCAGTGAACGGSCDGITADRCTYPGAERVCRPASCHVEVDVGIATLQASCDGAGHCPDILQQNCAPYTCTGVVCTQSCATEPCPNDQYCSAGLCVLKIPQGATCDSAAHCLSGFCVDGVCCESACTGQCEACNLDTHVGYCWPVTGVPNGGRAPCVGSGVCQGTCDGITRNACAFPGSTAICQNGNCSDGIASAAATCDGAGSCAQAAMQSCGAYVCGETTCKTACATDKDCGNAYYCVHSRCADHIETSGGGCGCGTGGSDRSGLLLVLLGLVVLAIKRRAR